MARTALAMSLVAAVIAAPAMAQDDELPDLEFLEYLGSWEEGDEEWLVVADEFMGSPAAEAGEPSAIADEAATAPEEDDEADATDEN
jgi:hypothetical protein